MAKVTIPKPPRNHLESGKKLSANSAVTTVTTYSPSKMVGKDKTAEIVPMGNNREVGGYGGYTPQQWTPGSRVQVGHPQPAKRFVALNEEGTQRIGEDHPRAKLLDVEVEQIRDEYEDGVEGRGPRIGYRLLAKKWSVSKRTIRDIVNYNTRNQWAGRWKRVT